MKITIIMLFALSSFSVFACRPNINGIKNQMVLNALSEISKEHNLENVKSIKFLSSIYASFHDDSSTGLNCPNQYETAVGIDLVDRCYRVDVVNSSKPENQKAEAVEIKCEKLNLN